MPTLVVLVEMHLRDVELELLLSAVTAVVLIIVRVGVTKVSVVTMRVELNKSWYSDLRGMRDEVLHTNYQP